MTGVSIAGWAKAALGDIAELSSGFAFPPSMQGRKTGDIPFAKVSDVSAAHKAGGRLERTENYVGAGEIEALRARIVPTNSTVFAKIGEAIRNNRKVLTSRPCIIDNNLMAATPRTSVVAPAYLHWLLTTIDFYRYANATSIPSIRKTDLERIEVSLPPLKEQHRILERLEAAIQRSRVVGRLMPTADALLGRLRKAILAAAFRGDLTAEWRTRNPDVEPADKLLEDIRAERRRRWEAAELARLTAKGKPPTDDLWKDRYDEGELGEPSSQPPLPSGWVWASLDQLRAYDTVVVYGIILPGDDTPGGVPYVRPIDMTSDGTVDISMLLRTTEAIAAKHSRAALESGDVILSIVGTIGKVIITPPELSGGNITQSSARIRLGSWMTPGFLRLALLSPQLIAQYNKYRFGNAVQRLNVEHVRNLMIPVPPVEEQRVLLGHLERLLSSALSDISDTLKQRLLELENAILARAFRGELVPQDPSDEPASVLLERLRAGIEAAPAKPGRRARAAGPAGETSLEKADSAAPRARRKAAAPIAAGPPANGASPSKIISPASVPRLRQQALPLPVPTADFLEFPADAQAERVHAVLLGEGPLEREGAVRRAADRLRDAGLATFQRLRRDGPLADCIDAAISAGLRQARFDRPARGSVRAVAPEPADVPAPLWRRALLAALASPQGADEAVRAAAEWGQVQFGLDFKRLRTGGHIDTALRAALADLRTAGEVVEDSRGILSVPTRSAT